MENWLSPDGVSRYCCQICFETSHINEAIFNKQLAALSIPNMQGITQSYTENISSIPNMQGIAQSYTENIRLQSRQGHGIAAERANHMIDKLLGKDVQLTGDSNAKNGPDRVEHVDSGSPFASHEVQIQTKYCRTGRECVEDCFDKSGTLRYIDADGNAMQIEVPANHYEAAEASWKIKIRDGKIPGETDQDNASKYIKKGSTTYEQAVNITRFCTVESLVYDMANASIVTINAMGISSVVIFARSIWAGENLDIALREAISAAFKTGKIAFLSGVISAQLQKSALDGLFKQGTKEMIEQLGSKHWIVKGLSAGEGAATASAVETANIARGNVVAIAVTTAVMSFGDISQLVSGKISKEQAFKNVTTNAVTVAGGFAGAIAADMAIGATIGSVVPIVGTVLGAIGGLIGGAIAGGLVKSLLDEFIEDDAVQMMKIFEQALSKLAYDFLLSEAEIDAVIKKIEDIDMANELCRMYLVKQRFTYAINLVMPYVIEVVVSRAPISLPKLEEIQRGALELVAAQV
jgi:hypothetical protein